MRHKTLLPLLKSNHSHQYLIASLLIVSIQSQSHRPRCTHPNMRISIFSNLIKAAEWKLVSLRPLLSLCTFFISFIHFYSSILFYFFFCYSFLFSLTHSRTREDLKATRQPKHCRPRYSTVRYIHTVAYIERDIERDIKRDRTGFQA